MTMEKLGIEKQDLIRELQTEFNTLRGRRQSLEKTAAAAQDLEACDARMAQIQARLDELQDQAVF